MRIDTRYGSIWDELPEKYRGKIPANQEEAKDFYEAAQSSMDKSLMLTMDSHNDMLKKSSELRKVAERKKIMEQEYQRRRDEQREFLTEKLRS